MGIRITKRKVTLIGGLFILISVYPLFVLIYTWTNVAFAEFEGGRHGPLDAYRHALASAIVAYTIDESVVDIVSKLMERGNRRSNIMDRHNNKIGAQIGAQAHSFSELEPAVYARVLKGQQDTHFGEQITWLSEDDWAERWLW